MPRLDEDTLVEQPVIDWLKAEGYEYVYGPDINPEQALAERNSFREVVLRRRLERAIRRLNPKLPDQVVDQAVEEIAQYDHEDLTLGNKEVFRMITEGKRMVWRDEAGEEQGERVRLIDFENINSNEFLVVNQFTIESAGTVCRPDVVIFINGLPLAVFELKSPTSKSGTIERAYKQIERYKRDIKKLFLFNQIVCVSDLTNAKHGTISSPWERFGVWKGIETDSDGKGDIPLKVLVKGMCNKERFVDIIRNFTIFEADSDGENAIYTKKMCLYHQYYGVCDTIENTIKSVQGKNERKIGVFWHTQGSGKSLSMVFYVNKTRRLPELSAPAYVFLTDREDLDNQLFQTFKRTSYQTLAKRAESIKDLKKRLEGLGSELVFTTIQKFKEDPDAQKVLSDRENIIVIADEAHRSQYSILAGNVRKALPNANFLGVTGTPISENDKDTQMTFGKVVSAYQINRAVEDGATVPIYYEGRLVPLHVTDLFVDQKLNDLFDEIVLDEKARAQQAYVTMEKLIGAKDRVSQIAEDVVNHFQTRPIEGKAMVVTMSRRIAVDMYEAIKKIPGSPEVAVVISKPEDFEGKIQEEKDVKVLEKRFKNSADSLRLVIVCDMWLTGFDVPSLHTMYMDKPLRNHGLMQAIARVNRVYKDKPGGLVVDYIGIADNLKKALAIYSSDIQKQALIPLAEVIAKMREKYDVVSSMFTGFDYRGWKKLKGAKLAEMFYGAVDHVISENGVLSDEKKSRFLDECTALSKLHALVMPQPEAMEIVSDVEFFQGVKKDIVKRTLVTDVVLPDTVETAIRDIFHDSIAAEGVIDIFQMQGKDKPEISIFDEKFIEEVKKIRFKNLAIDVIRRLLNDELRSRMRKNKVRYQRLFDLLNELIEKYENQVLDSAKIIDQLLELAEEIKKLDKENEEIGLSEEEMAFYDAISVDGGLKNGELKDFVKEVVKRIRRNLAVDWTRNETVKASIKATVRLMLLQKGIQKEITDNLVKSIFNQAVIMYRDFVPV